MCDFNESNTSLAGDNQRETWLLGARQGDGKGQAHRPGQIHRRLFACPQRIPEGLQIDEHA